MRLQWFDVIVILVVVLIIFGPKRLPELAKGLGSAVSEFKNALSGMTTHIDANSDNDSPEKRIEELEKKLADIEKSKNEEKPVG
jgi:TatA/E family protein of Tat protein translocase